MSAFVEIRMLILLALRKIQDNQYHRAKIQNSQYHRYKLCKWLNEKVGSLQKSVSSFRYVAAASDE